MRWHPSLGTNGTKALPPNKAKGGGAPVGASSSMSATHVRVLPPEHASAAVARHTRRRYRLKVLRARSPNGAPLAVLAAQINATAQPRPRFGRTGGCRVLPTPSNAPTAMHLAHRSLCRQVRCPGRPGAVCETARRNRTRPTFRIASRKRPSLSEIECRRTQRWDNCQEESLHQSDLIFR